MSKFADLDLDYRIEALFALGDLICSHDIEIKPEYQNQIVKSFDEVQINPERMHEVPQITFMLTTMKEAGDVLT